MEFLAVEFMDAIGVLQGVQKGFKQRGFLVVGFNFYGYHGGFIGSSGFVKALG